MFKLVPCAEPQNPQIMQQLSVGWRLAGAVRVTVHTNYIVIPNVGVCGRLKTVLNQLYICRMWGTMPEYKQNMTRQLNENEVTRYK